MNRILSSRWFILAELVLTVLLAALTLELYLLNRAIVFEQFKSKGGEVQLESSGPEWLHLTVGPENSKLLGDVVEVGFVMRAIDGRDFARLVKWKTIELVALHLDGNGDSAVKRVGNFRQIRSLSLIGGSVTDDGLRSLEGLPHLSQLSLNQCGITDAGLISIGRIPNLRQLSIHKENVTDAGLRHLKSLTELNRVVLTDMPLSDGCVGHLWSLPQLETLSLSGTDLSDAGVRYLKALPALKSLLICNTLVTDRGLQLLQDFRALNFIGIEGLDASDERIDALKTAFPNAYILNNEMRGHHYCIRGELFLRRGDHERAMADFRRGIRLDPEYGWAVFQFRNDGPYASELHQLKKVLAESFIDRGKELLKSGDFGRVSAHFFRATEAGPNSAGPYNEIAWLKATYPEARFRNGKWAVQNATKACELSSWKEPKFIGTLAAAYAEMGDFKNAVKWQSKALEMSSDETKSERERLLELYESGNPYREEASPR